MAVAVLRCPDCDEHIEWMKTRHGRRLPFGYAPIPVAQDTEDEGWSPGFWKINGRRQVVMARRADYPELTRQSLPRVVLLHRCPRYADRIAEVLDEARAEPG